MGDNLRGFRVVGTLPDMISRTEYAPGQKFRVTPPGREVVVRVPRGRGETVAIRYASMPAAKSASWAIRTPLVLISA